MFITHAVQKYVEADESKLYFWHKSPISSVIVLYNTRYFNKMYGIRYEPHKYFVKNNGRFFSILFVWKRLYTVVVILKNLFCEAAHSMLLNAHAGLC